MACYKVLALVLFLGLCDGSWGGLWVKDINVSYTKTIIDYRGENCLSEDINKGFGGKYVWICPISTNNSNEAATSFQLIIQNDSLPYSDLAKGAGGSYRYLIPVHDSTIQFKINNIWLSTSEDGEGNSGNINQGRGGRPLFLNWHLDSGDKKQTTEATTATSLSTSTLPDTTEETILPTPTPTADDNVVEVVYTVPFLPRQTQCPQCQCICTDQSSQWTVIILVGLFCVMVAVFGRFLFHAICKKRTVPRNPTPVIFPDNSFYPTK